MDVQGAASTDTWQLRGRFREDTQTVCWAGLRIHKVLGTRYGVRSIAYLLYGLPMDLNGGRGTFSMAFRLTVGTQGAQGKCLPT